MRTRRAILAFLAFSALWAAACGGGDDENFLAPMLAKFRHRVHGPVSRYDAAAKTFTVTDKKGRAFSFAWDDKTKVEGTIADGATATVRYRLNGSQRTATVVKIFPTAAPGPGAAPTTEAPAATTTTTTATTATTGEKKP